MAAPHQLPRTNGRKSQVESWIYAQLFISATGGPLIHRARGALHCFAGKALWRNAYFDFLLENELHHAYNDNMQEQNRICGLSTNPKCSKKQEHKLHDMTISITMEQSQRECDKSDFIDFLGGKSFLEGTGPTKLLNDDDRRVERWLRGYLNKEWENDSTTFESFCVVSKKSSKAIIDAFKKRLSKDRDARNYQATLGELRAFADLLRLGYFTTDYRGEKQAGCDFLVCKSENGEEVFQIEVFTMQDRPNCKSDLSPNVTEVCPFGIPTKDSNVTLEMVCKLHGIKERTRQVGTTSPALLYIDFQSMFPFGSSIVEHCAPMLEWNGTFTSGGIWLSFYGMKGQKVLENVSRAERLSCPDLPFLGLFSQKKTSPFAGAILSFPRGNKTAGGRLVYFENPFADHLLNPIARDMLLKHPDCNLQYSLWSTSHFNLIDYVSQQNNRSDVLFAELDKGFDVFT